MSYLAVDRGRCITVVRVVGVVPVVATVSAWSVVEVEPKAGAVTVVANLTGENVAHLQVYAERIAELLNRCGLSDIPVDSAGIGVGHG